MADDTKKSSIFEKVLEAGSAMLEAQIHKSREAISKSAEPEDESDFNFGKAITRDRSQYVGSQGFQEKPGTLNFEYQKQMAVKSSIVTAIIKTRQNQAASHSQYIPEGDKVGFKIVLKHEVEALEEIKEELFGPDEETGAEDESADPNSDSNSTEDDLADASKEIKKAVVPKDLVQQLSMQDPEKLNPSDTTDEDKTRQAKKELEKRTKKKKRAIADFILSCGETKDRPFESKKWSLDAFIRAVVWDSYVYDQIAVELIPKNAEMLHNKINVHHFQPIDGSTIRFASQELSKYKDSELAISQDILYPEAEMEALARTDALVLDDERLENNEYKYVQIIRGRIARAFTEDELKVGMRNPTTDIYVNGYSVSELELLVALVSSHLQTEFYNRSYFQQGFSAKGILHVKANLNRSKLEELRRHWAHMVKGNRNSFQTPIMAGMDDVKWIPLTQNHSEMEFSMWLNYLIKMICAIYQIDPMEIGYGMKDEGGKGGGLGGDNTKEKLQQSKDKGFIPLMRFLQDFLNKNIIDNLDSDYMLEWTGLDEESSMARVTRQEKEVKFKKSVNEIRAEDGLPPIKGADHLILDAQYMTWYTTMSEEGKANQDEAQKKQMDMMGQGQQGQDGQEGPSPEDQDRDWKMNESSAENDHQRGTESKMLDHQNAMEQDKQKSLNKSVKIEYYKIGK